MRVLLANDFYAPHAVGGAEALVQGLAAGLRSRGHEVMVVTARISGTQAQERIHTIPVCRIGQFPGYRRSLALSSGTAPGRLSLSTAADFQAVTRAFRPDVVHFHNVWLLGPDILHLATGRKGVTLHDYWPICVRRSMMRTNWRSCSGPAPVACRLCRLRAPATWQSLNLLTLERERARHTGALESCDFTTAPSSFMAQSIARVSRRRPFVVYNGINPTVATSPGSAGGYTLFAGRPTREKGYDLALAAFTLPGMDRYHLRIAAAVAAPRSRNVVVMGRQPPERMSQLIAGASCVIVPSIWPENCPMIVLEALRAGVPVVGSRIGGIPELVEDGVTGILVEPGNEHELADAIRYCYNDDRLRRSAMQHGPATIRERFSRERMLAAFEALYAS